MSIEIRSFEGDAAEAGAFVTGVWTRTYEGRFPVPVWDAPYFDWQLLAGRSGDRDFLVAAYDGTRLVGTYFAEPFPFTLRGEPLRATQGGWFTVDPGSRRQGVGRLMVDEQRRRHREREFRCMTGFLAAGTAGPGYWNPIGDTVRIARLGFWYRILDARRLVECAPIRSDRIATRLMAPFSARRLPEAVPAGVRDYRPGDLDRCLELAEARADGLDLSFRWTRERLAHQLDFRELPRTLVHEREGRVEGLVNWYPLEIVGRTRMSVSVLDLLEFGRLGGPDRRALLAAALVRMAAEGSTLAMLPRFRGHAIGTLLGSGFFPLPAEYDVVCALIDPAAPLGRIRTHRLHWR